MPKRWEGAGILAMIAVSALPAALDAQLTSNPGWLFEASVGRLSHRDDSGSVSRPEYRAQFAYRWCLHCGSRLRFDVHPSLGLSITDLAGVSLRPAGHTAVGSVDAGLGASLVVIPFTDSTRFFDGFRLATNVAIGFRRTTDRLTSAPATIEPVNSHGMGGMRRSIQVSLLCARLPLIGTRTLTLGASRADGSYKEYESSLTRRPEGGSNLDLSPPARYSSNSAWLGVQGNPFRPECETAGSGADSQAVPWRTHSVNFENDVRLGDDAYTQGLRLSREVGEYPKWAKRIVSVLIRGSRAAFDSSLRSRMRGISSACGADTTSTSEACGTISGAFVQTQYTPADLNNPDRIITSQPYVGLLYFSRAVTVVDRDARFRAQLDVGLSGQPSLARDMQSLAHWTWAAGAMRSRGWGHQLRFAPRVQLTSALTERFFERCQDAQSLLCFDAAHRTELTAGNIMGRASLGGIVRYGHNLPPVGGTDRMTPTFRRDRSVPAETKWIFAFANADLRGVAWNTLLTGHWGFDGGTDGWLGHNAVDMRPIVYDLAAGFALGGAWGGFSYQLVRRSPELDSQGTTGPIHLFHAVTIFVHNSPRSGGNATLKRGAIR